MSEREQVIERYMRDTEQKANSLYDHGYRAGKNAGYVLAKESGIREAWELMRDIADMSWERFSKAFGGYESIGDILQRFDYEEVKHRLEDFAKEELDNIEVGDEVIDPNGRTAIVTNTDTHYHLYYRNNGKTWKAPKDTKLTKTGHKYQGMEFLPF